MLQRISAIVVSLSLVLALVPAPALAEAVDGVTKSVEEMPSSVDERSFEDSQVEDLLASSEVSAGSTDSTTQNVSSSAASKHEQPVDEEDVLLTMSVASGTCGTCEWRIDEDGTLTIGAGTLASNDSYSEDFWPWFDYRASISMVKSEKGIVANRNLSHLFDGCVKLTTLEVSD